ncbi:hypothetical protein POPTR_006G229001v4 [Populus trichocarpa]|nr:hypothetical protein POPTR_006G229001v4 [Populus trichocarpa]
MLNWPGQSLLPINLGSIGSRRIIFSVHFEDILMSLLQMITICLVSKLLLAGAMQHRLSPKLMKRYSCSLNFHMAKMNSSLNILQSCVLVEFCGHDCLLSSLERVFSWLCLV